MMSAEELTGLASSIDTLVEEVKSHVHQALSDQEAQGGVREVVETTRQLCQEVARQTVESIIQERGRGYEGSQRRCCCGGQQNFIRDVKRTIRTIVGPIRVKRAYYRCPCGESSMGDEQFHCSKATGWSDEFTEAITLAATLAGSYKEASDILERLVDRSVSPKTIERLLEIVASEALEERDEQADRIVDLDPTDATYRAERVVVEMDGSMVNTRTDGWREVKLAQIYDQKNIRELPQRTAAEKDNTESDKEPRRQIERSRFVGHLGTAEELEDLLAPALVQEGAYLSRHVAVLGDGAPWIWNRADALLPRATQILDWWHASENVWKCARELYGEETETTEQWADAICDKLWEGEVDEVLVDLEAIETGSQQQRDAIDGLQGYLDANKGRMDYPRYRAAGWSIASGAIESSNKRVIARRLKQSGMRWTEQGAEQMIELRCRYYSQTWDEMWKRAA